MIDLFKLRSRRRTFIALAFAAMLLLGIAASNSSPPLREAGVEKLAEIGNAIAMLVSRSPGERTTATLTKTKSRQHRNAANELEKPAESAKAAPKRSRIIRGVDNNPADKLAVPGPAAQDPLIKDVSAQNPISGEDVEIANFPGIVGPGFIFDYPNPGGGFGGGGTIVDPPAGNPVSGVPEPESWIIMLLGMGLIGWALRRRPGRAIAEEPCGHSIH
ncbi:hypothetical protein MNBD_ALPHA04-1007 [hydrothermal vent metagenome]|uniref:Ice-binding protein C-terminal domain-containing protein n=1 Tax=hydrothermal vent metagenome TaxID=652676 RepID=A0A3B0T693_9ZZZZ